MMKLDLLVKDIEEVMQLVQDNDTLENGTVTLRDRDTMEQVTLKLDEVKDYIEERINF